MYVCIINIYIYYVYIYSDKWDISFFFPWFFQLRLGVPHLLTHASQLPRGFPGNGRRSGLRYTRPRTWRRCIGNHIAWPSYLAKLVYIYMYTSINHPPVITINRWDSKHSQMVGLWHCFTHITQQNWFISLGQLLRLWIFLDVYNL